MRPVPRPRPVTRREFLVAPGSIRALQARSIPLTMRVGGAPSNPGRQEVGFELVTPQGGFVAGGTPRVYLARGETARALGPFGATWRPFTGYALTGDRSPRSLATGAYSVELPVPTAGSWVLAAATSPGTPTSVGVASMRVTDGPVPARIGSRAVAVPTPVAATPAGRVAICSRTPACDLHAISLAAAVGAGLPTVVAFSSPGRCPGGPCALVLDEVILTARTGAAAGAARFLHLEAVAPAAGASGGSTAPPASRPAPSSAALAWGLVGQPWVVVIDAHGIVRARFLGPVTAPQLSAALAALA